MKKDTVKPSQDHAQKPSWIKRLMKIFLFCGAAVGLGIALCAGLKAQKKDTVDLQPLQSKIQSLQEKIGSLEDKLDKLANMKPPAPVVIPAAPPTESMRELFLMGRVITEYYQHKPFKAYLEKLLALPSLHSEKSEDITWLLNYGMDGTPSVETLLGLLETMEHPTEPTATPNVSFFENPLAYLENTFTWRNLFTIRSAKQVEVENNLKDFLKAQKFSEALAILETLKNKNDALKQALKSLIKSRMILNFLEAQLLKNLTKENKP